MYYCCHASRSLLSLGATDVSDHKPLVTEITFQHQLKASNFVAGGPQFSKKQHIWPVM
jgi:hypothetical protein